MDRPIIFSGAMVRALIDGRKTQTRRLATSPLRRCEPDDRLWVREAWRMPDSFDPKSPAEAAAMVDRSFGPNCFYEADGAIKSAGAYTGKPGKLRPSIHMPRWASRLTLPVSGAKFERLSDLTDEDAFAEGIYWDELGYTAGPLPIGQSWSATPVIAYRNLWSALHGHESLEVDPHLVALTFGVERANIDRRGA